MSDSLQPHESQHARPPCPSPTWQLQMKWDATYYNGHRPEECQHQMLERMWKQQELNCWLKCKIVQPLWKTVCYKINIFTPYNLVFTLLGIYLSKGIENLHTHKNLHMSICISSVYNCPAWKQSNSPSVGEWISKLRSIQTVECYLALKINELSSHEKTWRKLYVYF